MIVCFVDVVVFLVFRELGCRRLFVLYVLVFRELRMIDLFCRCRGLSCVQGVLLG